MTGDDILKLASELFARSTSPSEALCRNIVGRAYYGAYHLALALLAELGLPKSSDHKVPARLLIGSGDLNAKRAGRLLEDLYAARRRADYDLAHPRAIEDFHNLQFVKAQIEMASDIKSLLQSCSVEPVRSSVLGGIQSARPQ